MLTFCLFYFSFYSAFSGQTLFDSLIYSGFNFFLGWPIIGIGVFDRDHSEKMLLSKPEIYASTLRRPHLRCVSASEEAAALLLLLVVVVLLWARLCPEATVFDLSEQQAAADSLQPLPHTRAPLFFCY